jgi:16S rRNA (guanine527-N7)-methyltransferase
MSTEVLEEKLKRLCAVFLEENGKLNLSAFRTEETCWVGNILDSLAYCDLPLSFTSAATVLDLGTGGGFPLLPLAIAMEQTRFTGVDSVQKKVDAVERLIHTMELPNARCVCGRAEELGRNPDFREQFDIVTCRGVADVNVLLEYCSPFVKPKGRVVLWKSLTIDQELNDSLLARAELSLHLVLQHPYELPGNFGKRQLVVFEKGSPLSDKYPRDVGIPKKKPLL